MQSSYTLGHTMSVDMDKQHEEEGKKEEVSMTTKKESPLTAGFSQAPEDTAAASLLSLEQSRTERKRERERKRRGDVNKGLDALMELVFIIDPQLKLEAEERAARASGGRTTSADAPILSRVEAINSTLATLERVHKENEERKMVIARLAKCLIASGGGAATERAPAAALHPNIMAAFPNARDIQKRQELQQQQLNLEALIASSSGAGIQQSLHGTGTQHSLLGAGLQQSLRGGILPQTTALELARKGAASVARSPIPAQDLRQLGGSNPAVASYLGAASSLQSGASAGGLSIPNDRQGTGGDPTNNALYRAIVNRRIQDEESAALAAAGLPPIGSGSRLGTGGVMGRTPSSLLSHSSEATASPLQLSGDSIRQAVMREQTIAQAAAANAYLASEEGPARKRFNRHLS